MTATTSASESAFVDAGDHLKVVDGATNVVGMTAENTGAYQPGARTITSPDTASSYLPSHDTGGWGEVAGDLAHGAVDELTHHYGRVGMIAGVGVAIAVAAAEAPVIATVGAVAGVAYGAYELYKHLGGWLHSASVVANASEHSAAEVKSAHTELEGIGAGGVDFLAGAAGGLIGSAQHDAIMVGVNKLTGVALSHASPPLEAVATAARPVIATASQWGAATRDAAINLSQRAQTVRARYADSIAQSPAVDTLRSGISVTATTMRPAVRPASKAVTSAGAWVSQSVDRHSERITAASQTAALAAKRISNSFAARLKTGYGAAHQANEAKLSNFNPDESLALHRMQNDTRFGGGALFGVSLDRQKNDDQLQA
jgi:hypothetical protein